MQCRVKTGQLTPGPLLTGVKTPFKIVILAGDGQGPLDHGGETFEVVVREQGAGIPPEQRSVGDDVAQMSSRLYSAFANANGMTLECVRRAHAELNTARRRHDWRFSWQRVVHYVLQLRRFLEVKVEVGLAMSEPEEVDEHSYNTLAQMFKFDATAGMDREAFTEFIRADLMLHKVHARVRPPIPIQLSRTWCMRCLPAS